MLKNSNILSIRGYTPQKMPHFCTTVNAEMQTVIHTYSINLRKLPRYVEAFALTLFVFCPVQMTRSPSLSLTSCLC